MGEFNIFFFQAEDGIRDKLVTGVQTCALPILLGRLKIFEGVKKFPVRVKCAMLIWRALEDAMKHRSEKNKGIVTTEEKE